MHDGGASCNLVEPNPKAHSFIKKYFTQFKLLHKLESLKNFDIKSYSEHASLEKFDIIDAEGFIYTIKPESLWIDLFARIINDEGFVILFYCEAFGSFIELFLKAIHKRVCNLTGMSPIEAAQKLFQAKWGSIPHKRSISSWVMDVLENPFVRHAYFFDLHSLL